MTTNLEPIYNVWLFMDPSTRIAQTAAVKAYAVNDPNSEGVDLLFDLAPTDFLTAHRIPVPDHYVVVGPEGQEVRGAILAGVPEQARLVEEMVDTLRPLPAQVTMPGGVPTVRELEVPEAPMVLTTYVEERHDGTLVPVMSQAG